jgi:DNA-binding beta-propeller fold protein YncE
MNARRPVSMIVVICITAACALLGSTSAFAARGHVYGGAFGGKGSGNGQFEGPEGVAVNESTGRVYIADRANNRVEYFSSTGVYEGQFNGSGTLPGEGIAAGYGKQPGEEETGQFSDPQEIAVDNSQGPSTGDVYVTDSGHNVVDKFTASGEYIGQLAGTPNTVFWGGPKETDAVSMAVDSTGQLWIAFPSLKLTPGKPVARFSGDVVNSFIEEWEAPGFGQLKPGLAVDSRDNLYIKGKFAGEGSFSEIVEEVNSSGRQLNGEVGGELAPGWPAVESSSEDVYLGQGDRVSRYTSEDVLLERLGEGQLDDAAGIAVDSASGIVYVADFAADTVEIYPLESPRAATIETESVGEVTSESARLSGEINPRDVGTAYSFQYGKCSSPAACATSGYEAMVPGGSLSASFEVSGVSVNQVGLLPGTAYHFRLVADNAEFGEVVGGERVFVTQRVGGPLVLPDGRMWELVTPVSAHGATFFPISETGLKQASGEGSAFAYLASYPTESDPQGFGEVEQAFASRGPDGWSSVNISPPDASPVGIYAGFGKEYRFFSEDLSSAVVEPIGPYSKLESNGVSEASPESTERTPYVHHDATCEQEPSSCYEPLVTGFAGEADVSPVGTKFGGTPGTALGDAQFVGATPDVSHVVLSSSIGLTEEFPAPEGGLYEWSAASPPADRLRLVSVLPASEGGAAALGPVLGRRRMVRDAISDDGSRIIFSANAPGQQGIPLYLRDTIRHETIRLDLTENGSAPPDGAALFQAASSDGTRIFFTDKVPLTENASAEGYNLYECEIVEVEEAGEKKLKCDLTDLTPVPASGQPGAGEDAQVQGALLGVSEQGEDYVYFVANGVQAPGGTPGDCNGEGVDSSEGCSLYVRHAGVTSFIATLSGADSPDWGDWEGAGSLDKLTSRVSADGVWLAFMSDSPLTGYDNRDAKSGLPDEEVYLYDAQARRLVCASCNPTGARPDGMEYAKLTITKSGLAGGASVWNGSQWLAANVPGWTPYRLEEALYQSRYLSDSGRLFFNSSDGLVAQDTNGNEDVYEYEPVGAGPEDGECSESSSTFSNVSGGCVGLISSGVAFGQSAFLDASVNGSDVFFLTSEKLVSQDIGSGLDIYDAHECTAESPCVPAPASPSPECVSASACRLAAMAQPSIYGAPSSATFSGAGNVAAPTSKIAIKTKPLTRAQKLTVALKACRKTDHKRRAACQRRARKRYGTVRIAAKSRKTRVVGGVK